MKTGITGPVNANPRCLSMDCNHPARIERVPVYNERIVSRRDKDGRFQGGSRYERYIARWEEQIDLWCVYHRGWAIREAQAGR